MFYIIAALAVLILIYRKISTSQKYWNEKGIKYVRPWFFLGYMAQSVLRLKSFTHTIQDLYNTFPKQRYFGCYQFLAPNLIIRDADLIKAIFVKEFDSFPEHRIMIDAETDPLWGNNLFAMRGGDAWRDMRSTLSPAFTSSKMKMMFGLMRDVAKQYTEHYLHLDGIVSVNLKDLTTRYANDVIASTAFGVTCNSIKNPDNEFFSMTTALTKFSLSRVLKFFGYSISPAFMKFFKFRMFSEDIYNFYRNLIKETIEVRETKGVIRPDMIHLLLEAKKERFHDIHDDGIEDSGFAVVEESDIGKSRPRKTQITNDDITAQALLFFFAGFETISTGMSHLAYELALNMDVQKKLYEEINAVGEEDIGYETLLRMKYLDMVVSETLRKWPPAVMTDRRAAKSYTIEPERVWENTLIIEEGISCVCPIFAIHRDPNIYPNPDKFDPERFSDKNKGAIKPFTYLPFGAGPRNCIGSRFALLEMKTLVYYMLREFEVVPTEKTQNPLILSKKNINPVPDNGFWVGLKRRHRKAE